MANETRYLLKKELQTPNSKRQVKCVLYATFTIPTLKEACKYAPNIWKKNIKNILQINYR